MNHLKKYILFLGIVLFGFSIADAQRPFVTIWNTLEKDVTGPVQIEFPGLGQYEYTYIDAIFENNKGSGYGNGTEIITFPEPGLYRVKVTPTGNNPFYGFQLNNSGDKTKLFKIEQWGDIEWRELRGAFYGAKRMTVTATDVPDFSRVTNMSYAFADTFDLITVPNMNQWDVSRVTDMSYMFKGSIFFDEDISDWDVSRVINMEAMFDGATAFNSNIGRWNVSRVTNMKKMFNIALKFNQPIGNWDVSRVTDMENMFSSTMYFDQDLNRWNVKNVRSMAHIFFVADAFQVDKLKWKFHPDVDQTNLY